MINFEINDIMDSVKIMNPTLDFDSEFSFYHDETNNIKKFYVKEDDFNYSFHSNFVLGGVLFENNKPNVDDLFPLLKLQKSANELKFNHIAKGEFLDCLKSQKLNIFLDYLLKSPLYVHYTTLNILYYSIVDIVDSAIINSEVSMKLGFPFVNKLKNDLYKLFKLEIDNVIELFHAFEYPNVKKDMIESFINNLTGLFVKYENDVEFHFGLTSLKQILRESKKQNSLPFIEDEEDFILLKDLSQFYLYPIYTFKNSKHIFDRETSIEEIINQFNITNNGQTINSYRFEDSKNDKLIQVSDVFIGLVGKYSRFINITSIDEIKNMIPKLNPLQLSNLDLYLDIISKSDKKNKAFLHNVDCYEEMSKSTLIFELRNKIYT